MTGDRIPTKLLARRILPNADPALLRQLGCREGERSLGIFTTDCDDVSYAALDEATKKAAVRVVYARSMYAGAGNASTRLAGEFIGILAGAEPEQVRAGLEAAADYLENDAAFYSADEQNSVVYFAHCIARTGSYLSEQAKVPEGAALAYLIAPPLEATVGLDAALKAADVELRVFYGPPSETNFAGGLLTGDQAACRAACEAFARAVCGVAAQPLCC
ncbi:MAG: ethanolamine utilization microcompartment protein EutL [Oscillospiraceae bacterium]|jgi:ethanolamine utilization protein EutL|nr:ethanolamine utilization microcompartment protein EutL [Oscillospiraceae bacterium]